MKTYECKIKDESSLDFLRKLNASFGSWARKLFVKLHDKPVEDKNLLKREFQKEYGVSSTHYNSIKNHVDGIYRSRKELGATQAAEIQSRIKYTQASIKKLEKAESNLLASISRVTQYQKALATHRRRLNSENRSKAKKSKKPRKLSKKQDLVPIAEQRKLLSDTRFKKHQKKRRLKIVEDKFESIQLQIKKSNWSVCFGSKKLQRKQYHLEENDYDSHHAWLQDWQFKRSSQSFWLGDSKEKAGNRNARLDLDNGVIRLTVPECMRSDYGPHMIVTLLKFNPRAEADIRAVLESEDPTIKKALSYRILERQKIIKDKKGQRKNVKQLYLQVSLEEVSPPIETLPGSGGIGVDINCDHLAIGEVDRYGNPVRAFSLPIDMENKSSHQITAMFGDHIKDIVAYAKLMNEPISIEKLDFQKKKSALREIHGPKMSRLLSNFAYDKFMSMMASRCAREGVKLHLVNPAFSSVLGAYNYIGLRHL